MKKFVGKVILFSFLLMMLASFGGRVRGNDIDCGLRPLPPLGCAGGHWVAYCVCMETRNGEYCYWEWICVPDD